MIKVKIITLYSGEKSLKLLKKKLVKQKNIFFIHTVIEGLDQKQSNTAFYNELISTDKSFDYVIKMDADMLPKNDYSISLSLQIADILKKDRLTLPLKDFYTKTVIFGIHIFSGINGFKKFKLENVPNNDNWINKINGNAIL